MKEKLNQIKEILIEYSDEDKKCIDEELTIKNGKLVSVKKSQKQTKSR